MFNPLEAPPIRTHQARTGEAAMTLSIICNLCHKPLLFHDLSKARWHGFFCGILFKPSSYLRVALFLGLFSAAGAQTLQRHTEPPLHAQSCRDHIADQRKVFMRAAIYATDKQEKHDLAIMAIDLDDVATVSYICARPNEIHNVDLMAALAEYVRRLRLADALEGKTK